MYEVKAQVAKNRMLIRMAGHVTEFDCQEMFRLFMAEIQRLKPGFDLINDVRELTNLPPFPRDVAEVVGAELRERGVRRVVRVVGRQAAVTVALEKTSKVLGHSAALAYSMDEAEAVLERKPVHPERSLS